jgi:hypothetical protein
MHYGLLCHGNMRDAATQETIIYILTSVKHQTVHNGVYLPSLTTGNVFQSGGSPHSPAAHGRRVAPAAGLEGGLAGVAPWGVEARMGAGMGKRACCRAQVAPVNSDVRACCSLYGLSSGRHSFRSRAEEWPVHTSLQLCCSFRSSRCEQVLQAFTAAMLHLALARISPCSFCTNHTNTKQI